MGVANLPEMVKPVYVVKKPTFAAAWLPGVGIVRPNLPAGCACGGLGSGGP